ncbi:MAG: molybdopterin-dependent oxidoreductase [Adlercreutzia equolifaciens]
MAKLTMTRRTFAKVAAATAAAAGLASATVGTALAETDAGPEKATRVSASSCLPWPRQDGMRCVWTVQDGRVIKSEGDESAFQSAGNHCAKGQASLQAAYHPDRLRYPLKRTTPKGEDPQWQRISWDEAYKTTVDAIHANQDKYGKETCIFMGGTSRIWSMAPYALFKQLFGSPNGIQANEICKGPRFYATAIDASNAYSWMEVVGRPRVFAAGRRFRALQLRRQLPYHGGRGHPRRQAHHRELRQTNLGKEADIWVNLRPGTDGAVANCWAQVIIENELYDDLYVRKRMNAPMLVVQEESFKPTPTSSAPAVSEHRHAHSEGIRPEGRLRRPIHGHQREERRAVLVRRHGCQPRLGREDWKPATEGREANQPGLDATGQTQGFVLDYVPFPDRPLAGARTRKRAAREATSQGRHRRRTRTVGSTTSTSADYTPEKASEITWR